MRQHKPDGFRELLVYKRSDELRLNIVKLTDKLPYDEKRRKTHLNDSVRSVKQNIVEGWKRTTTKEYFDFLSFSLGSLAEIKEDIKDLFLDKKITEVTRDFCENKCNELDFLLNQLRKSLYLKMEREGTLPSREKSLILKNQKDDDRDIFEKLLAEAGLEKSNDGKIIQKGEKG